MSDYLTLPDHLIIDHILFRLPVKPLCRFKCVSNFWKTSISRPEFTKKQFEFSRSNTRSLILQSANLGLLDEPSFNYFLSFDESYNLIEFVELDDKYPVSNPTNFRHPRSTTVVGSCNGLLCIFDQQLFNFYVCNPATNQLRNIDDPVSNFWPNYKIKGLGFGYLSSVDDHKIVCFLLFKNICCGYIFSLTTGKWTETAPIFVLNPFYVLYEDVPVLVDDTMYWVPIVYTEGNHIVGINLVDGKSKEIQLIDSQMDYEFYKVFQMKECLALCCIKEIKMCKDICDVWILKQHTNGFDYWDKILSLKYYGSDFLYFFESGKCLVKKKSGNVDQLVLYDHRRAARGQEQHEEEEEEDNVIWGGVEGGSFFHQFVGSAWEYFETFVSPFGPTMSDQNGGENETDEEI